MKNKKILIGISGSIAAYKTPLLVRLFMKAGAEVKVVMTPSSVEFVSPLVLSTLSKNKVLVNMSTESDWANHVALGRWADVMVIAPASCNTIARMANGVCDNLLLSVYLSATCPVILAPAMDEDMWKHPSLKNNVELLKKYGNIIVDAEFGELASGLIGMGRMAEPETIFEFVNRFFNKQQSLLGQSALVTAGPTYENIDPVRFIGNHSSGKMGIAIAEALANRGCKVHLVLGPSSLSTKHEQIHVIRVTSAAQMFEACKQIFPNTDIAVMSAAVADYTPVTKADQKIKKKEETFSIALQKTSDILKHLGSIKKENQILVGFALETNNERENALKKLHEKNADMIVLNSLQVEGAGFSHDTNQVTIFQQDGKETNVAMKSKVAIAEDICGILEEWSTSKTKSK